MGEAWEYGYLYFLVTMTEGRRDYGPKVAIAEDSSGARLLPRADVISAKDAVGADGWIVDGFATTGGTSMANQAPGWMTNLARNIEKVDSVGEYKIHPMRRSM